MNTIDSNIFAFSGKYYANKNHFILKIKPEVAGGGLIFSPSALIISSIPSTASIIIKLFKTC